MLVNNDIRSVAVTEACVDASVALPLLVVGSPLGLSPVTRYAFFELWCPADHGGPRPVLEVGDSSSFAVVLESGEGLELQVFQGDAEAVHSPGLPIDLDLLEGDFQPVEEDGDGTSPLSIADGDGVGPIPLCSYSPSLVG